MPTFQFSPRNQFQNVLACYDGITPFTPSDTVDVPVGPGNANTPCVGIYVATAGNVAVQLSAGGTAVLSGLAAGQITTVGIKRILATGTTATGCVPLYDERG